MAINYTSDFWLKSSTNSQEELESFAERKDSMIKFYDAQAFISNPYCRGDDTVKTYSELLSGKKLWADKHQTKIEKTLDELECLKTGRNVTSDIAGSKEYQQVTEAIKIETQLKYLQLYYDQYMAELNTDMQWRLGNAKARFNDPSINDEVFGLINNGTSYTRSTMSMYYSWEYFSHGNFYKSNKFYTNLGFPPYKFGAGSKLNGKTNYMDGDDESTFDRDNFTIKRENFVIRDVGMKALSDYINYLQWVIEGATGVVSTYLTEWDLSVYIQEKLMRPKIGGGPMNIYLNFGIYTDNPLAEVDSGRYTDDAALTFNVCGSAVSKLFYDCTKYWRPSDYPQSAWWMPYIRGRDFTLKNLTLKLSNQVIPYMSIYDTVKSTYSYKNETDLLSILKHQDFIGMIAAAKPNEDLHFYDAFYATYEDALADIDIKMKNLLNSVAGADAGQSSAMGKDIDYLIMMGRKEMLMNGGYFGGPQSVGSSGGYMGRSFIEWEMDNGSDDSNVTASKMMKQAAASGTQNDQTFDKNEATTTSNAMLDNKKDASQMAKLVGINRFSPSIYGGPHGSDYSPFHLRDYFKADSLVSRNIPKVDPTLAENIDETNEESSNLNGSTLEGNYSRVSDGINMSQSPTKTLRMLKSGTYTYQVKLVHEAVDEVKKYKAKPHFDWSQQRFYFEFPEYDGTSKITYDTTQPDEYIQEVFTIGNFLEDFKNNKEYKSLKDEVRYGIVSSIVICKIPVRIGMARIVREVTKKIFYIDDRPTTNWKIVSHKFTVYKGEVYGGGETVNSSLFKTLRSNSKGEFTLFNDINSMNPAFVLTFDDPDYEEKFISQCIRYNRGITDSPRYMYFFGSDGENLDKPDYAFRAPCYVRYYKNITEVYTKWLWKKKFSGIQETFMPFIYVDLNNATEYYDGLNCEAEDTARTDAEITPIHLRPFNESNQQFLTASPLQKISQGFSHTMIAFKNSVTEGSSFGVLDAVLAIHTGGVSLLFKSPTSPGTKYPNRGEGDIMWTSKSEIGIKGKGILSGWQGIDPSVKEDIAMYPADKPFNGLTYTFTDETYSQYNLIKRPGNLSDLKNIQIENLPLKANIKTNDISEKITTKADVVYKLAGVDSTQTYCQEEMPDGIRKAINTICSRVVFYPFGQNLPCILKMNVPYRNFFSYCATERNYLQIAKEIISSFDFANLRKILLNNVDACVLKACGLKKKESTTTATSDCTYEICTPDPKHVLYNYWIAKAIEMFFNYNKLYRQRNSVLTKCDNLISLLKSSEDKVLKICNKDSKNWTYNDILEMNSEIYIQSKNIGINKIDEFLFAYVNLLYCYRLFFIGKRFNKEDGTMWIMRALESTIDLVATNEDPPKPAEALEDDNQNNYGVAFYEIQNTLDLKRTAVIDEDHEPLNLDKIVKIYVQVEYGSKENFEAWIKYRDDPDNNPKAREMIQMRINKTEVRYAFKPEDGLYCFRAKEFDDNYAKVEWNNHHKNKTAKPVEDYINCVFNIEWSPDTSKTPIRFNVFGNVDVNNLLQYSQDSLSAQDMMCLTEVGADFWTIKIPVNVCPETKLYKKGLYIIRCNEVKQDAYQAVTETILGPFANSVYPIVEDQGNLSASIQSEFLNQMQLPDLQ